MRLSDYLDKGASAAPGAPCFTTDGSSLSYREVQRLSVVIAAALRRSGVVPGDKVAILSANDPVAFAVVFGISRVGAVWSPINPRSEASEDQELLDQFDCSVLIYQAAFASLVAAIRPGLPKITTVVCLDGPSELGPSFAEWTAALDTADLTDDSVRGEVVDDLAMIVGTGGTTGRPKGVMLTTRNLETMTSIVLMSYPFTGRPVYLALAPLTHAAGVLSFPILALAGEIVIMPQARHPRVRHPGRAAPGDARLPAADVDLPAARSARPRSTRSDVPAVLLVRSGADVHHPADRSTDPDRSGDGPAVRSDRGADDDLHDGPPKIISSPTGRSPVNGSPRPAGRRPWSPWRS